MFEEEIMPLMMNTMDIGGPAMQPMPEPTPVANNLMAQSIIKTAENLGISPVDLATVISYETAGTFDPWKAGPTTQWGQHRGLIQWGEPQARKYGVSAETSIPDQLAAVGKYLVDAGVQPGMGIMDVYSAINAGRVGRYNASDANNGGAPGTVADKVNNQMSGHRVKAVNLLNGLIDAGTLTAQANRSAVPQLNALARRPSIAEAAADGGPLLFPDQVPASDPAPVAAPAPSAGQQLQALLAEDEKFAAMPTATEIASIPVPSNIPQPIDAPTNEPTWLDAVTNAARGVSMGGGKLLGNVGEAVMNNAKQVAAKAQGTLTGLPMALGASLSALPAAIGTGATATQTAADGSTQTSERPPVSEAAAELATMLAGESQQMQQAADFQYGAGTPQTAGEKVGAALGRSIIGGGPAMIGGFTAADLASQGLSEFFAPPAGAAPRKFSKQELDQIFGQQPPPLAGPIAPAASVTIPTPAGPTTLPAATLWTMGGVAAATLGMAVAPATINMIKRMPYFPKFDATRPVPNAAPGTNAISKVGDLARVYDDVNAPLFRIAKRAGIDLMALKDIEQTFRIQTGSAARNLVHSAVSNGRMETPNYTFQVKVPLAEMVVAEKQVPMFKEYMQARALADNLIWRDSRLGPGQPPSRIGGAGPGAADQDITAVLKSINDMEKINPDLSKAFKFVQDNIVEGRRFISTGEYAILGKGQAQWLNQAMKNTPALTQASAKGTVLKGIQEGRTPLSVLEEQMHRLLRQRMENEATGTYIDAMRKQDPSLYTPVTPKWIEAHKGAAPTVVSFYRRGKKEYYTTDPLLASIHKADPYFFSGGASEGMYVAKRIFESSTTGLFAPFFASTSAIRSYQIQMLTALGEKKATPWGMMAAVPQQAGPAMAKAIGDAINNGSGGWLTSVLGNQFPGLGDRLVKAYDKSFYAQLAAAGGHQGSFLQHNDLVQGKLVEAASKAVPGWAKFWIERYKDMLNATHNAASFSYAKRNAGTFAMPELAMKARNLTGDPTIAGQKYVNQFGAQFGYQSRGWMDDILEQGVRRYGDVTEFGRNAVPWWNITTQGMKRLGRAYVDNPVKFTSMLWATQLMPTAALYMFTRGAGTDPNGVSYIDYAMDGRSEYNRMMNMYVPIPGKPVWEGVEIPRFHETSLANSLMMLGLDQAFGRSSSTPSDEFWKTAGAFVKLMDPPMPPLANLLPAGLGQSTGGGIIGSTIGPALGVMTTGTPFGGESYRKRSDPFDQLGGLNASVELVARALAPGIADIAGASYAAATQTPDGLAASVQNGAKAAIRRSGEKTPVVRDFIGWKPPVAGNTKFTEELFSKSKAIRNLGDYIRVNIENEGAINIKPQSKAGGRIVDQFMGQGLPRLADDPDYADRPGLYQPEPTNPLFKAFAIEVNKQFQKDSPDEGGFGYKSMWRRYSDFTEAIRSLNKINEGNYVTWQMQLGQNKEMLDYLKENNINYKDPKEVKNFFTIKRNEAGKVILNSIKAVEEKFNQNPQVQMLLRGKKFRIEDIDPYAGGGPELPPQGPM